ncbi:prepilin-type N-terminal cleavage/methylation domain-containing protein [Neobacillus niacini]|uniref:prepilin-type N-terminal cleavage/methylation domain-containing protein n=1 Tax=Neobacillus niacini TaxID=86668 RepID=UPI002FFF773E
MINKLGLKLKEQKGFTLIELLAVIVILGIIAAIAIPAIGNVITKSENKAKVQDALLIINAAKLYVATEKVSDATTVLSVDGNNAHASDKSLGKYLDRVADDDFLVTVTYDSTKEVYSYTIQDHEACALVGDTKKKTDIVSEKTLSTSQYSK